MSLHPCEALNQLLFQAISRDSRHRRTTPGELVLRASSETREALRGLTSDLLATMRSYPDDDEATAWAKEVSRLKRAFDAEHFLARR